MLNLISHVAHTILWTDILLIHERRKLKLRQPIGGDDVLAECFDFGVGRGRGQRCNLAVSVTAVYSAAACPTALLGSASVVIPTSSYSNCAKPGVIGP